MKRLACPACHKQLFVSEEKLGKRIPCPKCGKQLALEAAGLVLADEITRRSSALPVRPKPGLVPLIAPVKEVPPVSPAVPPQAAPPVPADHLGRQSLLVPIVGGAAFLVAVAATGTAWLFFPAGSKREIDEAVNPTIVHPLEPFSQKREKRQPATGIAEAPGSGQEKPDASSAEPSGQREEAVPIPKAAPQGAATGQMASAASQDRRDPIQDVIRSVAVVGVPGEGHGSAFVVAPGVLVTNHHVIENAVIRDLRITFPDNDSLGKRALRAELIHVSIPDDLAFLAIDADVAALEIKPKYEHVNGQRVVAVGSPGSGGDGPTLENLITDGRLGPEVILDGDRERWSLSMSINGGNSGGPLVAAETGEVIGVIVAYFSKTEGQSLAIPHDALVRELAHASATSDEARATTLSLHRQRYCLLRMSRILEVTSFAFNRSIAAAMANSKNGPAGMDAAFNECKTKAANIFSEHFADFSSTVGGEVEDLQNDPHCDLRVRRGLRKLLSDIENQADEIRRRVPREEISTFLGRFEGSVNGSHALVTSLSEKLHVDPPEISNN